MKRVTLGEGGPLACPIGFGCEPLGGHAWGPVEVREIERAVERAVDRGVTLFDTADVYGLGRSEERLAAALGDRRREVIIATKGGVRISASGESYYDNSPAWLQKALHASLTRLNLERIPLYQIHYWDGHTPFEEIFEWLERMVAMGKIDRYGLSNVTWEHVPLESPPEHLATFSLEYSLARREHEKVILAMTEKLGMGFLGWGSLGQGILTGKYGESSELAQDDRRRSPVYRNFHGEELERNLRIVEVMTEIAKGRPGVTLPQIALRWILDTLGTGVVLTGIKSRGQLEDNLQALDWELTAAELRSLDAASQRVTFRDRSEDGTRPKRA